MIISREKKALAVLVAMLMLIGSFAVGYVFVGHSLNAAVTTIDEAVGSLEGYTVLLFEGTQSTAVLQEEDAQTEGVMGSSLKQGSAGQQLDAKEAPSYESVRNALLDNSSEGLSGLVEGDLSGVYWESEADRAAGLTPLDSLRKSYELMGAATLRLDLTDPHKYSEGLIVRVGSKRIGVMSAQKGKTSVAQLRRNVRFFRKHDVRFVVCVSNSKKLLRKVKGINVAVLTYAAPNPVTEVSTSLGTSYVYPPVVGSAGAAIVGPGYVVSARTQFAQAQ